MAPSYESIQFSKKAVRRAGVQLSTNLDHSLPETKEAMQVLTNWRAAHSYILNKYNTRLRSLLTRNKIEAIVSQRLKRLPSIVTKLERYEEMSLDRMQDIAGMRIVVKRSSDLYRLLELINSTKTGTEVVKTHNYVAKPKDDGYRCIHFVIQHPDDGKGYGGLRLELQIRTELQHAWATGVEIIDVLEGKSLKTSLGSGKQDEYGEMFALLSSCMADREGFSRVGAHVNYTLKELSLDTKIMCDALDMTTKLTGFKSFLEFTQARSKTILVIGLDYEERNLKYAEFSLDEKDEAFEFYADTELKSNGSTNVLLVQNSDLEELKKAYPNYFGGATRLVDFIVSLRDNS